MNRRKANFELPPLQLEKDEPVGKETIAENLEPKAEIDLPDPERSAKAALTQSWSAPPPTTTDDPISQATTPPTTSASDLPAIAEDNDLIEKEWVDKAKKIVEQTKDDPYKQNREINRVRADYMKKRYNKDIRQSQE